MTEYEEDRIVLKVIERVLNLMPETIGNLMSQYAANNKLRQDFYNKHPEFKDHTDVVASVVERLEGDKLGQDYEGILERSVPYIANQIKIKNDLNTNKILPQEDLTLNTNPEDDFREL